MEEKYPEKRLYKAMLLVLKVIPMLLALTAIIGMGFDFLGVDGIAVAIADSLDIDLESETPAYISGDSVKALAESICEFGCPKCN